VRDPPLACDGRHERELRGLGEGVARGQQRRQRQHRDQMIADLAPLRGSRRRVS